MLLDRRPTPIRHGPSATPRRHTTHFPEHFVDYARGIKQAVPVPVIAVGRIEPEAADRFIGEGVFDFVAMGRKLLADPVCPTSSQRDAERISAMHVPLQVHRRDLYPRRRALRDRPGDGTRGGVQAGTCGGGEAGARRRWRAAGMEAARIAALPAHSVASFEARTGSVASWLTQLRRTRETPTSSLG